MASAPDADEAWSLASERVRDWLDRPAWNSLVELFGGALDRGDVPGDPDDAAFPGEVEAVRRLEESGRSLARRLVRLEEFADFCWNFRRAAPRGLLHLLRRMGDPQFGGPIPLLARPEVWLGDAGRSVERLYLGSASDGGRAFAAGLSEWLEVYPASPALGYRERWQAVDVPFSEHADDVVRRAATVLEVVEPTSPTPPYDHVVVLGGGGRSPLLRAAYAEEAIRRFDLLDVPVWLLGSPRPVEQGDERRAVAEYAADASDEFDLMTAAAMAAFGASVVSEVALCGCESLDDSCRVWSSRGGVAADATPVAFQHERLRIMDRGGGAAIRVLSASTSNPPNRPNTADTYELFGRVSDLGTGDRVLIVTTQVFVPFQRFDAVRMLGLPYGARVDVIGFGEEHGDRPGTSEYYLQELLSGLRSARRLLASADTRRSRRSSPT